MSVLTSWVYPLQGIIYLASTPQLLKVVLKFLAVVTAASLALTAAWIHLAWDAHLALVDKAFGLHLFTKPFTLLLLLTESALPVYAVFDHRFKRMQQQLFVATLQLKSVQVSPLCHADAAAITAQLAQQQRQQQQVAHLAAGGTSGSSKASLAVGAASSLAGLAFRILLKPKPNEGLLVRKTRDFVTLGTSLFLPLLLPLYVYRDSHAEASSLLSAYWHSKGVTTPEAQEVVAGARAWELRGFGLVAVGLSYVPVLSWFLGLSNMVGAALYAAAMEQRGTTLLPGSHIVHPSYQR